MAKIPKSGKRSNGDETGSDDPAQDAVEDAVVIDDPSDDTETPPNADPDAPETADADEGSEVEDTEAADTSDDPLEEHDQGDEAQDPFEDVAQKRAGPGLLLGGFVLAGVIAGIIGFGAAQYASGGWPFATTPEEDPIASALEDQARDLSALGDRVDTNAASLSEIEGDTSLEELGGNLRADIVATQSRIEEINSRLGGIEERISALEKMPQGDSAEAAETAAAAYERELAEMRAMLDREIAALKEQQADAETLQLSASEAANAAAARAAMSRVMAALDNGQPFEDALFDLSTATGTEIPPGLEAVAPDGVPTLAGLQESYPDAARAALDDALRAMVEAGEIGRGEAFLRTQLGARSLEARAGDDPDAILSRAEAALKAGRIDSALETLDAMPEAAQPALADWIERARTRAAALESGAALSQSLNQ